MKLFPEIVMIYSGQIFSLKALSQMFNQVLNTPQACDFIKKETLGQVFSGEFCKISKNIFSYRAPPVAASAWRGCVLGKTPLNVSCAKLSMVMARQQMLSFQRVINQNNQDITEECILLIYKITTCVGSSRLLNTRSIYVTLSPWQITQER